MRWPWKPRAAMRRDFDDKCKEIDAWNDRAAADGFCLWQYNRPTHGTWVEAKRREWTTSQVWQENGETPWLNVSGLWWRPWRGEEIAGAVIDEKQTALG